MTVTLALTENAPEYVRSAVLQTLTDTTKMRHVYRTALETGESREEVADMFAALAIDMLDFRTGRHSVEWRSLMSAFDAVATQLDIEESESYRVTLTKRVSLSKRAQPNTDTLIRSGR